MKDKLPSYEFKMGEGCWCCICELFTEIAITENHEKRLPLSTRCSCSYDSPSRPLTLAEARLLRLEPPWKTKTVTMWQCVYKSIGLALYVTSQLFENEADAKSIYRSDFIKLVNPIEVEVEE